MKTVTRRAGMPSLKSRIKKYKWLFLFLLPSFALVLIFSYVPYIGILYAFKSDPMYIVTKGPIWAFFESAWTMGSFKALFADPEFLTAVGNTVLLSVLKILFLFPMGIIIAIWLSEVKQRWLAKIILIVICLPHFLSWSVVIAMWTNILDPLSGAVNNFLVLLGLKPVYFLGSEAWFKPLAVFIAGWKGCGWNSIIFYASISAIDRTYYDAARIDGASRVRQILSLTLPIIMPTIALMLVINITYLFSGGFEQIQLMINSLNRPSAEIIDTFLYRLVFMGDISGNVAKSTALGVANGLISLLLMITGNAFVKKTMGKSIW